jgi:hypothetical protein
MLQFLFNATQHSVHPHVVLVRETHIDVRGRFSMTQNRLISEGVFCEG